MQLARRGECVPSIAIGAQRTARPTFFCDWRFKSVPLRSPHGFADETYVGGKVRGMGRDYKGNKAIAA